MKKTPQKAEIVRYRLWVWGGRLCVRKRHGRFRVDEEHIKQGKAENQGEKKQIAVFEALATIDLDTIKNVGSKEICDNSAQRIIDHETHVETLPDAYVIFHTGAIFVIC